MAESQQKRLLRMLNGQFDWKAGNHKHMWSLKKKTMPGGKVKEKWWCQGCKKWKPDRSQGGNMLTSITLTVPEEYVRKNYTNVLPDHALPKKVEQVKMRVELAEKLRIAALTNMEVNNIEPVEGSET